MVNIIDWVNALSDPEKPMNPAELLAWVAAIATAVATVVTAAVSFWFRKLDQPRAKFEIIPVISDWYYDERDGLTGSPSCSVDISNVGTGPARIVSFIGISAMLGVSLSGKPLQQEHLALMEPGQTVGVEAHVISTRWNEARILISWSEPRPFVPWSKRKRRSFKLSKSFNERLLVSYLTDPVTGKVSESRAKPGPEALAQIRDLDREIESSENLALARPNFLANQWFMRKLSRAGWLWRRKIATKKPE